MIGRTISHYQITGKLGRRGMGEVYRAHDTKLARDVAIKILPDAFAHDADRVARFTREAKTLAALNHPGIAQIYGVIETPDLPEAETTEAHVHALVMELVEGEYLAQRLTRGAIPLDEALPIAQQIAGAFEAAHEVGIVHRDLKPANVKLRPDGRVKVLDFGLAKATDVGGKSGADLTNSPTVTAPMTQVGVILGTAAYVAPEQASGKPADRRADIWAFGAVLCEMLASRPLFTGDSVTEALAAVLRSDVPWGALPPSTRAPVVRLLHHCLERDPMKRLSAVGDARFDLDEAETEPPARQVAASTAGSQSSWWKGIALVIALTIAASVITGAIVWNARPNATPQRARFATTLGPYQVHAQLARNTLALSPDGRRLAYVVDRELLLRNFAEIDGRPISGSADPQAIFGPVFSPDGRYLLFDVVQDKAVSLRAYSAPDKKIREVPTGYSTVPTTAVFSPDGHWIAYTTQESNMANAQLYVQPFPATGAKCLVSNPNDDGHHAVSSRDGRELFYTPGPGNRIQKVVISMAPSFQYSRPEILPRGFTNTAPSSQRMYDVGRDGRFLALIEGGALKESGVPTSQIVVVLNWLEEPNRLVRTN